MLSLINDDDDVFDDLLNDLVSKLCNDEMALRRLRSVLFPDTTQESLESKSHGVVANPPPVRCSTTDDTNTVSTTDDANIESHSTTSRSPGDGPSPMSFRNIKKEPFGSDSCSCIGNNTSEAENRVKSSDDTIPAENDDTQNGNSFNINIQQLTAKVLSLNVESTDSIATVKDKIYNVTGYTPEWQRLIFIGETSIRDQKDILPRRRGHTLTDENLLSDYKIHEGSLLHLVLRGRYLHFK